MNLNNLLEIVKEAALKGGEEILKIYETDFSVEEKDDKIFGHKKYESLRLP